MLRFCRKSGKRPQVSNKKCPICRGSKIDLIKINFTSFRHLGFDDFVKRAAVGRCMDCQMLINILTPARERKLTRIYQSLDYAQGKITGQTYLVKDYDKRVTRSFLQAEILQKYLNDNEQTKVLDVGCFNGELLIELSQRFPKARFHGFDVNKYLKAIFPSAKNFTFWQSTLDRIEGKFDLISMSCSMGYIKDINGLFRNIRRLLKPKGLLFIQINDIVSNPYSILLADQYFYFTPRILKNILSKAGFNFTLLENNWFPRDILGIAKLTGDEQSGHFEEDLNIYQTVDHLNEIKKKLQLIANRTRLCVLGTTATAAFVDSILGDRIHCFVDENMLHMEAHFRGKRVIHPRSLNGSCCLILPYGSANKAIKKRFSDAYNLKDFQLI